jgi:hypothetical protein
MAHQRALQMRVGIVLAVDDAGSSNRPAPVSRADLESWMRPFSVVPYRGRDVHRGDELPAFLHATFFDRGDFVGDADELLPGLRREPR